jgi:ATP-binding cassette subfamily C protein
VTLPVADKGEVRTAARGLLSDERRAVAGMLALHLLAAASGLAAPWLLGRMVDTVSAGDGTGAIDRLALFLVVTVLAHGLLTRAAQYASHRFGERAIARLREEFVWRVLDLPVSAVERAGTGDLATRSSVDVSNVGNAVRNVLPILVVAGAQVLLLFGAIFLLSPLLGLVCLVGLPPVVWVARWYLRRANPAYLAEGVAQAEVTDALAATSEGARTVEALRLTDERIAHGTERVGRLWRAKLRTLALRTVVFPVVESSYALPIGTVLLAGGFFLPHHWVTLGQVVAAALYLQQAVDPIDQIMQWMEQLQRGLASYARVLGVSLVPPEPTGPTPPGTTELDSARDRSQAAGLAGARSSRELDSARDRSQAAGLAGARSSRELIVRGATFAYTDGRDVLHGIDLDVRPGERLAIVGPSGAGKSTLARLLAGMDRPGRGEVTLGGVAVTDLDPAERRRQVALITQEHHVFMGSLRDNLAFAAPGADEAQMLAALDAVGADWFGALPDGLETVVGDGALALTAAEAQQLALARLVLADPHTLVLDEATAALDPTAARRTERALAAVLTGRTVIAIAHRLNTAHDADRVAVLEDGRITELGRHDELIETQGAYAALWRSWHG